MTTYGTMTDLEEGEEVAQGRNGRSICCHISDYSEPCIWVLTAVGLAGLLVGIIQSSTIGMVIGGCMIFLGILSGWRVHVLGVAFALMESVDQLREENLRLNGEISHLRAIRTQMEIQLHEQEVQTEKLTDLANEYKGALGLLGENVKDSKEASDRLLDLYRKYKEENLKQERNNLIQLFHIIDRDNSGQLSKEEMDNMREFVKSAYGRDINEFDTDRDGVVTMVELAKNV